jgi:hypothetical protein
MSWDEQQSESTAISHTEWNTMVKYIKSGCKWLQYSKTGAIVSGAIRPYLSGQFDIGTDQYRIKNIYCSSMYGTPHYQDIYFTETWCEICGETFEKGDQVILTVKNVGKEMSAVPAHLKCGIEKVKVDG